MLNTLNVNLNTDLKVTRVPELGIKIKSQDINNNLFILRFTDNGKAIELDETYTVEILTKFEKSKSHRLTSATVYRDYARWEFDTSFITQDEKVTNYVYVRKAGNLVVSADANAFAFDVGLSEIDKGAGRVAEVYDENYQKYLDEFKDNVDFEEIAQAEQARKEAEILREENYNQKVDTAIVEADVVDKVDNKVTELTPKINDLTAQLAKKANQADLAIESARINNIIASGTTTEGNTELIDTRVGADGHTYATSGEAIRENDKRTNELIGQIVTYSTNLIDKDSVLVGYIIPSGSGEPTVNVDYSTSEFIEAISGAHYSSKNVLRVVYYNSQKQYISHVNIGVLTEPFLLAAPANARYMRISTPNPNLSMAQLNKGNTLAPYEPYRKPYIDFKNMGSIPLEYVEPENTTFFNASTNLLLSKNALVGYVLPAGSGEPVVNASYTTTDFLTCFSSETYTGNGLLRAHFFDGNKNYIGLTSGANSADSYNGARSFVSSVGAQYMRVSFYNNRSEVAQLNRGSQLLPYEESGQRLKEEYIPESIKAVDNTADFPVMDMSFKGTFHNSKQITTTRAVMDSTYTADIYSLYDALMAQHPTYITKTLLGNEASPDAIPIYRYDFKPVRPETSVETRQAKILITSGVHPELTGIFNTYHMMEAICNDWQTNELLEAIRFNIHLIVVPSASPWAVDNRSRKNFGGVDIARNFPAGWVLGDPANDPLNTYGGPEPLSEIEAQVLNQIMIDNPDMLGVLDVHNFNTAPNEYHFLWGACANRYSRNIMMSHIQQMDRKWKKEYSFVNPSPDILIGYTNGNAPGGSIGVQAHELGFIGALTYETAWKVAADTTGTVNDKNTLTMGYEALTNFLLLFTDELLKRI